MNIPLLLAYWFLYCVLHSVFADERVKETIRSRWGRGFQYYRLTYNLASTLLLIPALVMEKKLSHPLLPEHIAFSAARIILALAGIALFYWGAKSYDMKHFLGLSQIRGTETEEVPFSRKGLLSVVRHPWYLGGILILWSRKPTTGTLTTNLILTAYLIVGARLEERKLVKKIGPPYEEYIQEVPMLLPRPVDLLRLLKKTWGRGQTR